jgi:hypothetical protein
MCLFLKLQEQNLEHPARSHRNRNLAGTSPDFSPGEFLPSKFTDQPLNATLNTITTGDIIMVANVENIIIEQLKALRNEIASLKKEVKEELKEATIRLGRIELAIVGARREIVYSEETTAEQSIRIDRLAERIDRIETRLELS